MPEMQMTEKPEKNPHDVVLEMEETDISKNIGWNLQKDTEITVPSYLAEVHVSHKQITDRFVELLNLFEDYSRIMESEQAQYNPQPKLKRTQSEQHMTVSAQEESESSEVVKTTVSLNRMQLSDSTILAIPRKHTCEVAIQTSWPNVLRLPQKLKIPKQLPPPETAKKITTKSLPNLGDQQTLLIEVESVTSSTALQRPPLRQRMWHVLVEAWQSLIACFYMMGENFTYVLFVMLCMWCLYLIISHYYSFLGTNVGGQHQLKHPLAEGGRAQPR